MAPLIGNYTTLSHIFSIRGFLLILYRISKPYTPSIPRFAIELIENRRWLPSVLHDGVNLPILTKWLWSISTAIRPYSPALSAWTPLLLVTSFSSLWLLTFIKELFSKRCWIALNPCSCKKLLIDFLLFWISTKGLISLISSGKFILLSKLTSFKLTLISASESIMIFFLF